MPLKAVCQKSWPGVPGKPFSVTSSDAKCDVTNQGSANCIS